MRRSRGVGLRETHSMGSQRKVDLKIKQGSRGRNG